MSITSSDFAPLGFVAVMNTGISEVRVERVLKWLPNPWSGRLPEPFVLPITSGVPAELPRIQWQSDKRPWGLAVARSAVTVNWHITEKETAALALDVFLGSAKSLLLNYRKVFKPRVGRLACVCQRFARIENPAPSLAEHFCRPQWLKTPFNRPENFEIHSHKSFDLAGSVKVNSWMRVKTGTLTTDPPPAQLVVIAEQDLNTLREEEADRDFKDSEITQFFKSVVPEMDRILNLYFPKGRS